MVPSRCFAFVFVLLSTLALSVPAQAAEEIVELHLQRAKCLCGIVTISGEPVSNAKVEELGEGWKGTLRSTDTDSEGHFRFTLVKGRKIYFLRISARAPGVNPLQVPVKISRVRGAKLLRLQLHLA
jgi:hypothetical protein